MVPAMFGVGLNVPRVKQDNLASNFLGNIEHESAARNVSAVAGYTKREHSLYVTVDHFAIQHH